MRIEEDDANFFFPKGTSNFNAYEIPAGIDKFSDINTPLEKFVKTNVSFKLITKKS